MIRFFPGIWTLPGQLHDSSAGLADTKMACLDSVLVEIPAMYVFKESSTIHGILPIAAICTYKHLPLETDFSDISACSCFPKCHLRFHTLSGSHFLAMADAFGNSLLSVTQRYIFMLLLQTAWHAVRARDSSWDVHQRRFYIWFYLLISCTFQVKQAGCECLMICQ